MQTNTGAFVRALPFPYQWFASFRSNSPSLFKQQPFWTEPCTPGCLQKAIMSLPQLSHASNDPVTAGRKLNLVSVLVCLTDLLWTVKGGNICQCCEARPDLKEISDLQIPHWSTLPAIDLCSSRAADHRAQCHISLCRDTKTNEASEVRFRLVKAHSHNWCLSQL